MAQYEGRLLSRSATTGWLDWMHGELWLFPDGLLRIPMGWGKTIRIVGYFFNPRRAQPHTFSEDERAALVARRRNTWIPSANMRQATLRHSLGADELVVTLANGHRKQLLWIPDSTIFTTLRQILTQILGSQLSAPRDYAFVFPPWLDEDLYIGELEFVHTMLLQLPDILAVILYGSSTHRQEFVSGDSSLVTLELLVIVDTDDERIVHNAQNSVGQILGVNYGIQLDQLPDQDNLNTKLTFVSRELREVESQLIAAVAQDGLLIWARGAVPNVLAAVAMRVPLLNPYHWSYER